MRLHVLNHGFHPIDGAIHAVDLDMQTQGAEGLRVQQRSLQIRKPSEKSYKTAENPMKPLKQRLKKGPPK